MSSLPSHLAGHDPTGLVKDEPIAQFEIGNLRNFVYLILDWQQRVAAWVDPQSDLSEPLHALEQHGFRLDKILLTHSHHDHVAGVPELARKFPDVEVWVHEHDRHRLTGPRFASSPVKGVRDGHELKLGSLSVSVMHTPGHSKGECSFLVKTEPPYLLTGDTVFIRDCGRTDFEDGSNEEMFASLRRIAALPGGTVILPGHHYAPECASTVARELETSPPFACKSVEELRSLP